MKWQTAVIAILAVVSIFRGWQELTHRGIVRADEPQTPRAESGDRSGRGFIPTPVYTQEDDLEILKLFEGLRVADVFDGMDKAGLQGIGAVDPAIHALWKDTQQYSHRFIGIAVTARYVPTNRPPAGHRETAEFDAWVGQWYQELSPEPFVPLLRQGSALVIDDALGADVGSIGSNNIMSWVLKGCVGVVTSATARDTDEIAAQKVPLYLRQTGAAFGPAVMRSNRSITPSSWVEHWSFRGM